MNFKKTLILWAVGLFVTTGSVYAQVKKKPTTTPHKTVAGKTAVANVLPVDPNILTGKLPNGLTYYIRANGQPKGRAQLLLVSKAGSVIETDAQRGMANLIQHLAFKGTRDFSKAQLNSYLTKLGNKFGPDTSAFTSYDATVYQLALATDTPKVLSTGFSLLANWASRISFNEADINAEKSLLAAKAALGGKTADDRLQQQTLPVVLNNSRYSQRATIGTEATINNFTTAAVKSFYADWYRPDLQGVIAVGDFDPKQILELIKFNFSSLRNPIPEKPLPQFGVTPAPGTVVKVATDKAYPYTLFQIINKHPQMIVKTPADVLQNMRINLFNQLVNIRVSDLTKIPSPPIVYGQSAYAEFMGRQDAFSTIAAVNNPLKLETAVKAVFGEIERVRKFGFTLTELERAKQNTLAEVTASYSGKDNAPSSSFAGEYERSFLNKQATPGIDYEYSYYVNNIGKISVQEMDALAAQLITDQNRVILLEANDAQKDKLPTEQTLLKWIAEAGTGLSAYVDDSAVPLMDKQPTPGKLLDMKVDSVLSVINITLTNGIKVILKPTGFTPNQILITANSFGGTSLASDQDFTSANLAAQVIGTSGVAGFNQAQLIKMLRDKSLSLTPYIGDISQGISGYTAASNFDSAMQLLYLYFTSPRKDEEVWKTYIDQTKAAIAKNANDPGTAYQDTVISVLGGYNPRAVPVTEAKLNAASLDKAYSFYKDRFADASNFTFTFTGDFAMSDMIPYLATYLGSLPVTNSKETFKNLGIHPLAGQVTKKIYKGTSDKSTVQLVFNGEYEYNDGNNIQMDALEEILNIRLVDSLKDGNGIYSPSIRVNYVKNPEGRYKVTLEFLTDAGNTDKAIAFMLDQIDKLKQTGPTANEVTLFVTREARTIQAQFKQNTFWQAALSAAVQNKQSPRKIISHVQDLEQVTRESVKYAVGRYLNTSNLIKVILLPEKK